MVWPLPHDEPDPREVPETHDGAIQVVKLNVDDNPEAATRFKVLSIPTMLVFKDGQVVKQLVGAMSEARLEEALAEWVATPA